MLGHDDLSQKYFLFPTIVKGLEDFLIINADMGRDFCVFSGYRRKDKK